MAYDDDVDLTKLYPSNLVQAEDLRVSGPVTYTISSIEMETVGREGQTESKAVVRFSDCESGLALNKTNSSGNHTAIRDM